MNVRHINLIRRLFQAADEMDLPLWLRGGWAIDARLRRVTREHEDIDLAYPEERKADFLTLLKSFGGRRGEDTACGFLITLGGIPLDCMACVRAGDRYELEGPPPGTCPWGREGTLSGTPVRCVSWEAILWDYFQYLEVAPESQWKPRDAASYALARKSFGVVAADQLHERFKARFVERRGPE